MLYQSHFEGSSILLTQPAPTAKDENGPHIHTRVLHALVGKKDEDAAVSFFLIGRVTVQTGSAHCALIPHYLDSEAHRSTFNARCHELQTLSVVQQSAETGEMVVQWLKDRKKVRIFGNAVEISRGEVDVDMTG
jgi:predicted PhzF superfamily epimerase YddE/YHI9